MQSIDVSVAYILITLTSLRVVFCIANLMLAVTGVPIPNTGIDGANSQREST